MSFGQIAEYNFGLTRLYLNGLDQISIDRHIKSEGIPSRYRIDFITHLHKQLNLLRIRLKPKTHTAAILSARQQSFIGTREQQLLCVWKPPRFPSILDLFNRNSTFKDGRADIYVLQVTPLDWVDRKHILQKTNSSPKNQVTIHEPGYGGSDTGFFKTIIGSISFSPPEEPVWNRPIQNRVLRLFHPSIHSNAQIRLD